MHNQMPQEIEVWYVIPALRRELAKSMILQGNSQKEIAKMMGITESAVSQYIHSKRAKEVLFSKAVLKEIERYAADIVAEKQSMMQAMMHLTRNDSVKQITCDLHKKQDITLKDCDSCFEEELVTVK